MLLVLLASPPTAAGDGRAAVEIVAIRPDEQCRAVLSLFDGAAWPHPAAALADWKRSAGPGEERSLGKPFEALITTINPLMARELASLDNARLLIDLDGDGRARWAAVVPGDDGTLPALATALVLTDGASQPREGRFRVDRLGPAGSPLVATNGPGDPVIVASGREAMADAVRRVAAGTLTLPHPGPAMEMGWIIRAEPEMLAASGSIVSRRLAAAMVALGYGTIEARASLRGETLELVLEGSPGDLDGLIGWGAIEPHWLDPIPNDRTAAALAMAIGPGPGAWGKLLDAVDQIDRADSERAEIAPLRVRLALLSLLRGVRLDADLWPNLVGLTIWIAFDELGVLDGGMLALHAPDEAAASRMADRVISRIAVGKARDEDATGGLPLEVGRVGASVLVGWGDGALEAALAAVDDPDRSAGPILRADWDDPTPSRLIAAWPGRLPWSAEANGPLRGALDVGRPIRWLGWSVGDRPRDVLRWDGLREPVHHFLDQLPARPVDLVIPTGALP